MAARVRGEHADEFALRTLARFARLLHGDAASGGRIQDTVDSANRFATVLNEHNRTYAVRSPWVAIPTRRGHFAWQPTQVLRVLERGGFPNLERFKASFDTRMPSELLRDITHGTFARLLRAEFVEGGHATLAQVEMSDVEYSKCREILDSAAFNADTCPSYGPGFVCNRRFKRYRAEHTIYLFDLLHGETPKDLPASVDPRDEQRRLGIIGSRTGSTADWDPWASYLVAP